MISFYPGPSRIHDEIPQYVKEGFKDGIFSMNHRSETFVDLCKKTVSLLKNRLDIPDNFHVYFTSSATECWEIIAQSVIHDTSIHYYNGAFGEKWFNYTKRLRPRAEAIPFLLEGDIDVESVASQGHPVICITQNETSNGTQVSQRSIRAIRKKNPASILAIDATSSMAGIKLDFKTADIWFASVQKCFGLPAGLGIMICSPKVIAEAEKIAERNHYNSLLFMADMMSKWQTPFTPNVMGIYLLMRVLEKSPSIGQVHEKTIERYQAWIEFLSKRKTLSHLVEKKGSQSNTVIAVTASPELVAKVKSGAKQKSLLLGEGYGDWKLNTFRIANFPALKKKEIKKLMAFLEKF